MGYRNYSVANGFTVDKSGNGDFTTIGSALSAASAGDTIFIRPGTYTENPALVAGVNLVAFDADALTPNVIINGECTFSSAGTVTISGIELQTNSNYCLAVTGSAASTVYLNNCYINCSNNTGINFTSSSSSALIKLFYCNGNLGTTSIALITCSSAGTFRALYTEIQNSGNSTTASAFSAGTCVLYYCHFNIPFSTSGSTAVLNASYAYFNTAAINTTCVVCNATTANGHALYSCQVFSGSASAISVGASAVLAVDYLNVQSTSTDSVTGSGTITFGNITYSGTTVLNNVTTQDHFPSQNGSWTLIQTQVASASASIAFTTLYNFTNYVLVWSDVYASSSGGQAFELLYNQGGGYVSSGYSGSGLVCNTAGGPTKITTVTAYAVLGNSLGSGSPYCSGQCFIYNAQYTGSLGVTYQTNAVNDDGSNGIGLYGGSFGNTAALTGIEIKVASGNIAAGTFSLYGINT